MKRDWVIWGGCVALFGAGVIWGKISGGPDFFKVANIHDLFEILGATATVIAASVAVSALSGWKGQFAHAEKYRAIRDFHGACQGSWNGYWYVSYGYNLIEYAWANRETDYWFHNEIESYRKAWGENRSSLERAFSVIAHHLAPNELELLSKKYWEFMNQVSYGESEVMSYTIHCAMLIEEPKGEYADYYVKGSERLKLIDNARSQLCDMANVLFGKYAQPE
ncbi:hypothetical protein NRB16_07830 [Pseudomonas sp. LJDD11]|uniref:hypothetical protein n=1 Tax=Pseudomonas sp. LJDD11 TaxID=2931984 RepID=UPI00211B81F2|nr:hypothetical protein [Pseudomonas sp. LJDD11]MCQ9423429.1 hypothetical protein [Pseudomonas sp. LJDD11]